LPKPGELPKDLTHLLICGWPHPPFRRLAKFLADLVGRNIFTALDAGPFLKKRWTLAAIKPVLPYIRLFLVNEYELKAITAISDMKESMARLRRVFSGHIVLKRGARGACWISEHSNERKDIAPFRTRALNTVGAGDSFNGALLARLTLGSDFPRALAFATKVAARVVSSPRGVLGA
jgi:sugar/nucleoside kinase (ribokinase family)